MTEATIEAVETAESKFILRRLNTSDAFKFVRVIAKIGLSNFKRCFQNTELSNMINGLTDEEKQDESTILNIGFMAVLDAVDVIAENLPKCENELYSFLAGVAGMKECEVRDLAPADFLELLIEVIKKPEFADFIKVALRLFTSLKMK